MQAKEAEADALRSVQLDMEFAFITEQDIQDFVEGMIRAIFKEVQGVELAEPFPRLTYFEAMRRYGSDKPDLRIALELTELTDLMKEAVRLEKAFIEDCLPINALGLSASEFTQYIDYIADRRLESVGLSALNPGVKNPLPWLAEMMDIKKEQNFFEGRVTEYHKASAIHGSSDDEL